MKKFNLMLSLVLSMQILVAQNDIDKAKKYLEKQIVQTENIIVVTNQTEKILIPQNQQKVLKAGIAYASITFKHSNKIETIFSDKEQTWRSYFLYNKNELSFFKDVSELIVSEDFIKALNTEFRLKTEEDVKQLREVLYVLNGSFTGKIFKREGKWCILRYAAPSSEVGYFEITTTDNGQITTIENIVKEYGIREVSREEKEMPSFAFEPDEKTFNKKLKQQIKTETLKPFCSDLKIVQVNELPLFEVEELKKCKFTLLQDGENYNIVYHKADLLNKTLLSNFSLIKEEDIKVVENLLNYAEPNEEKIKRHYKKYDVWCFVRKESAKYSSLEGVLILSDKKGKIIDIEETSGIESGDMLSMKLKHDPDLKLDYKFTLAEPSSNKISITAAKNNLVKITFNADAVNVTGAYIATIIDGKNSGFSTASTMESPFTDKLNASSFFEEGKYLVEYILLPPGDIDTNRTLAAIKIEVDNKDGVSIEEKQQLDKFVHAMFETIRNNNIEKFSSYVITKQQTSALTERITDETPEAQDIRGYFEKMDTEEKLKSAKEMFNNFQTMVKEKKLDIKDIKFKNYAKKRQDPTPYDLNLLSLTFIYELGEVTSMIDCELLLTKDGLFMLEFNPSNN